jgi:hypothetical protein
MEGMKMKKTIEKRKGYTILLSIIILLSLTSNGILFLTPLIKRAEALDVITYKDTNSTVSISIRAVQPRINWYDFQDASSVSQLDSQIDVNQEYKFCINISSDQGWDDIQYINVTAWYDNVSEANTYNLSLGGNINLFLQYENLTGNANYNMLWPTSEAIIGNYTEAIVTDSGGSAGYTECHNLTFSFTPGYQFRYSRGDGSWDNTYNVTDDEGSWNFRIDVADSGENASQPATSWILGEFGVYSYTEITSAGSPNIQGNPGFNVTADSNITVVTRSNCNYSISSDVDNLLHNIYPVYNISNQTIWIRGGNLNISSNLTGSAPIYLYGSSTIYSYAENNGTEKTTSDVEYGCDIPMSQQPGDYSATITYIIKTET